MSSILRRCRRFSTLIEEWISRLCTGDGGSYFYEGPVCVCVPEACDVRIVIAAILKKKLILLFGVLGRIQRMRVKDCTANSRAWGRPRT